LAVANPRIVGMYSFIWDLREVTGQNWIDSRRMFDSTSPCYTPTLKGKNITIGQSIITGVDITAPLAPSLTNLTGGATSFTIIGTSENNSKINIYNDKGIQYCATVSSSTGQFSCTITIVAGRSNKLKIFSIDTADNWSNPTIFVLNGDCIYSGLPTIGQNTGTWGDNLNSNVCQSTETTGAGAGKLRTDIGSLTTNGKVGIGTNNPGSTLSIVGLNEYATEALAIASGFKNGDFYRMGDQVKVVVNSQNITDTIVSNSTDTDCSNTLSTARLPTTGQDNSTWGNILNNFLCKSYTNKSGQEGKLKTDLASITVNNKVGIGIKNPTNSFAINGLIDATGSNTTIPLLTNLGKGDLYHKSGKLQVSNSNNITNSTAVNPQDCYQSTQITRLPKTGFDVNTWGSILNNFLCRSHLNGGVNSGKLKTDLSTIVEVGKIGIGTNNPTSVLTVPNLPNYTTNAQAIQFGLKDGDIYRSGNDVMVVYTNNSF
jgi:Bacterial Ig domain